MLLQFGIFLYFQIINDKIQLIDIAISVLLNLFKSLSHIFDDSFQRTNIFQILSRKLLIILKEEGVKPGKMQFNIWVLLNNVRNKF